MNYRFAVAIAASLAIAACASDSGSVTVYVTILYPDSNLNSGQSINLRGSAPLSWTSDTTLQKTAANTWQTKFLVPSTLLNTTQPTFDVDLKAVITGGIWQLGCNHRFDMVLGDQDKHEILYPYFATKTGVTTTITNVFSPQLNNTRDVWIYVPPGMVENPLRVERNVLIMHDGQNLQPLWLVNTHLDAAIIGGIMESVFIMGPYNTGENRINEYTYSVDPSYGGGEGDKYLDFLEQTLVPLVNQSYKIATAQKNLGIMGSSLGGLISCYAGITRPHVYSTVGCMSSSFWWNYQDFYRTILPRLTPADSNIQRYYMDSGDSGDGDDDRHETSRVLGGFARTEGFSIGGNVFYYLQRGGQHNEYYWSSRFTRSMQYLYFRGNMMNYNNTG